MTEHPSNELKPKRNSLAHGLFVNRKRGHLLNLSTVGENTAKNKLAARFCGYFRGISLHLP